MATTDSTPAPLLPIPIYHVAHHYYLYHLPHIMHLRIHYRIAGALIGSLPQSPQQNVFLGLPVKLLPEEVRLLVDARVCYIIDDVVAHREGLASATLEAKNRYNQGLKDTGKAFSLERARASKERWELKKQQKRIASSERASSIDDTLDSQTETVNSEADTADESLFSADDTAAESTDLDLDEDSASALSTSEPDAVGLAITPTTSYPLLGPSDPLSTPSHEVTTPRSYPLFKHLATHPAHTFFLTPGLRFGCQYLVYPGDPLRFHSHFLAINRGWDEEMDLLTLVGGGRLGTGVKKGFLVGGVVPSSDDTAAGAKDEHNDVRVFCLEWAGM